MLVQVMGRTQWVAAWAVFAFAFALRLLSEDYLQNDHFMHLAWSRQLLAGDVPVRDFLDPGMPLSYLASAVAQRLLGPTEFAEVLLCSAGLALAAALSFVLGTRLSGSAWLGLLAAALQVVMAPRLYAYPRLLIPVVALWVFGAYAGRPDVWRRWLLAVLGVVAFLFRHDYGIAVAAGALVLVGTLHRPHWRVALRQVASCAGMALLLLLPWLLFWQMHGGIASYLRGGVSFAVADRVVGGTWDLGRRPWFSRQPPPLTPRRWEVGVRWADGMTEAEIRAAATSLQLVDARHEADQTWRYLLAAAAELGSIGRVLAATGWPLGPSGAMAHAREHIRDLRLEPPIERFGRPGAQRHALGKVARYVRDCTRPSDRLMVTWFAPELYFYTERPFAAGVTFLDKGFFSSERDQRLAVPRLDSQTVPIILVAVDRYDGTFRSTYPFVHDYLNRSYRLVAEFGSEGGSDPPVGVLVSRRATAEGVHQTMGLPCFRS
ncbi:MAG: hypothetical protein O3A25_01500 [Acidobacteria bacterium]|nr:hypothetical protein [Acidobacteriota bacterium]